MVCLLLLLPLLAWGLGRTGSSSQPTPPQLCSLPCAQAEADSVRTYCAVTEAETAASRQRASLLLDRLYAPLEEMNDRED